MKALQTTLVILAAGLAPAAASACDEDAKARPSIEVHETSASATSTATVTVKSTTSKSWTVTATVKACAEAGAPKAQGAAASKQRRPGWSPGHLIEPDSMRLAPQQRPEDPGAEWVIISSRHGAWHVRRHSGKRNT
jgi:hypothetical protein